MVTGVVPSSPRCVPYFLSRIGFSIPAARRFPSNVANSRSRAFRQSFFFMQEKVPTSMRSVRLEPTKLILIGTRTTYQATGDAGSTIQQIVEYQRGNPVNPAVTRTYRRALYLVGICSRLWLQYCSSLKGSTISLT